MTATAPTVQQTDAPPLDQYAAEPFGRRIERMEQLISPTDTPLDM